MTRHARPAAVGASRREPFSVLVATVLALVGIVAFVAFLILVAFRPHQERDLFGGSALSDSAVGFAGIVDLLRAEGVPVTIGRVASAPEQGLLVLTPLAGGAPVPPERLAARNGATLVVLPKWRVAPLEGHPGWVAATGTVDLEAVRRLLPISLDLQRGEGEEAVVVDGDSPASDGDDAPIGTIARVQSLAASEAAVPMILDTAGRALLVRIPRRRLYVLAEPDLLDTHGLRDRTTAILALAILDGLREGGPVTFDVTLAGFGTGPNLLRMLFAPPVLGATLAAGAAGLLLMLMALNRFGPVRVPDRIQEFGKRALVDNSAGLIALAKREPRMARPYAELLRTQVLAGLGASPRLDAVTARRLLDTASQARGLADDWSRLSQAAEAVRGRADLVAVAQRLHRWRGEMTRDDR